MSVARSAYRVIVRLRACVCGAVQVGHRRAELDGRGGAAHGRAPAGGASAGACHTHPRIRTWTRPYTHVHGRQPRMAGVVWARMAALWLSGACDGPASPSRVSSARQLASCFGSAASPQPPSRVQAWMADGATLAALQCARAATAAVGPPAGACGTACRAHCWRLRQGCCRLRLSRRVRCCAPGGWGAAPPTRSLFHVWCEIDPTCGARSIGRSIDRSIDRSIGARWAAVGMDGQAGLGWAGLGGTWALGHRGGASCMAVVARRHGTGLLECWECWAAGVATVCCSRGGT